MMTATDVHAVMDAISAAGRRVWLDGGWAVDAVVGEQTRDHDDLDLVGELTDVETIEQSLAGIGYRLSEDERPVRAVFADGAGRSVDLHTVTFDEGGGGIQALPGGGSFRYPPEGFSATGRVGVREFPCLTPEVQLLCHLGYEIAETDRHDVNLLCERFGLELPPAYR
jgi:lincosamide nucleotidyltransferase A/C/D/E